MSARTQVKWWSINRQVVRTKAKQSGVTDRLQTALLIH